MRRIAFYEDSRAQDFGSLTLLRPVFELLCGHFTVRERVLRHAGVPEWGACLRPWLVDAYQEEHPESRLNDGRWLSEAPTLFVNGRWLGNPLDLLPATLEHAVWCGGELAALVLHPDETVLLESDHWEESLLALARTRQRLDVHGVLVRYPWDLITHNPRQITVDHQQRARTYVPAAHDPQLAILGDPALVSIDPGAHLDPFVVIDVRQGPVFIDAGAKILAFTRLEGPCYIGRETQLFRALVCAGTPIGPGCRVGGEIEESIFLDYSNKYHDGFLGHSVVGQWVNLGALTTNSDLKNDYSAVRVPLAGTSIDSGSTKVGCFIGDHTKTALGSLFNTGSAIGVMCMILPAGELLPKHIPSFTRIWHGQLGSSPVGGLDAALDVARIAMSRRNRELTPANERLLRRVFGETAAERHQALSRSGSPAPRPSRI